MTASKPSPALSSMTRRNIPSLCLWVTVLVLSPFVFGAEPGVRLPGDRFRECPSCPLMVVVPAGEFLKGSPPNEEGRYDDEGPQHPVRIERPFAVGVYEVTFDEWDACERDFGCSKFVNDGGWGRGSQPLINVSWNDAQEYVAWLSGKTGAAYRLLSESEWEYAARAGTTTRFHFGSTIATSQANYSGIGSGGISRDRTVPVGQFPANGFGLHDVHGNVDEWVQDCYHGSYDGAPRDGSAWESGGCPKRVLRGGCWNYSSRIVRSANRYGLEPDYRYHNLGFRVAQTLTP